MAAKKTMKITVVGDSLVGKTCLLYLFTKKETPDLFLEIYSIFENYVGNITVDGEEIEINLRDTQGLEDYERLRPLYYKNTDCFLLCYSVGSQSSFENVVDKWYPELNQFSSSVPIVLVATQSDLRVSWKAVITTEKGQKLKKKIRAAQLVECSALERINMNEVFEEAVRAAIHKKKASPKRPCHYL